MKPEYFSLFEKARIKINGKNYKVLEVSKTGIIKCLNQDYKKVTFDLNKMYLHEVTFMEG